MQSILGQNWNIKELKETDPSRDESLIVAERYSEDNVEVESSVVKIQDLHVKLGSLEKAEFEASACMCSNVNKQVGLFLKIFSTVMARETKERLCENNSYGPLEHLESLIVAEINSKENVKVESVVETQDFHVKSGSLEKAAF